MFINFYALVDQLLSNTQQIVCYHE